MPIVGVIRQSLYYIPYYDAENEIIVKKYVPKPKRDTYIISAFFTFTFSVLNFLVLGFVVLDFYCIQDIDYILFKDCRELERQLKQSTLSVL